MAYPFDDDDEFMKGLSWQDRELLRAGCVGGQYPNHPYEQRKYEGLVGRLRDLQDGYKNYLRDKRLEEEARERKERDDFIINQRREAQERIMNSLNKSYNFLNNKDDEDDDSYDSGYPYLPKI